MKSKLSNFCLIPLMVLLTFFLLSNFQFTEAFEIITHWVPDETYKFKETTSHKASNGEILSKEEYDSLGNGNSFSALNPPGRTANFYDGPEKLPTKVLFHSDDSLNNKVGELEKNLRNALVNIDSLQKRVDELEKVLSKFK